MVKFNRKRVRISNKQRNKSVWETCSPSLRTFRSFHWADFAAFFVKIRDTYDTTPSDTKLAFEIRKIYSEIFEWQEGQFVCCRRLDVSCNHLDISKRDPTHSNTPAETDASNPHQSFSLWPFLIPLSKWKTHLPTISIRKKPVMRSARNAGDSTTSAPTKNLSSRPSVTSMRTSLNTRKNKKLSRQCTKSPWWKYSEAYSRSANFQT